MISDVADSQLEFLTIIKWEKEIQYILRMCELRTV